MKDLTDHGWVFIKGVLTWISAWDYAKYLNGFNLEKHQRFHQLKRKK